MLPVFYVIGNSASIAGVVVSLLGLGFAILQIRKLRGETRAALEAAQETRQAIGRELTTAKLTSLDNGLQELKRVHREGDRLKALDFYYQIQTMLAEVRRRHPDLDSGRQEAIAGAARDISVMESQVEELDSEFPMETKAAAFNNTLSRIQRELIPLLEDLPGESG